MVTLKDKIFTQEIDIGEYEGLLKASDVKEFLIKFDKLLKSDLLSDAECGNDKVENARTWNAIVKTNRRRLKDIFGDWENGNN